jgi:hypothetical protein
MYEGFQMKQDYEYQLHLETLFYNRQNTAILLSPNVKKQRIQPLKLYKLPCDKKETELTKEEMVEMFTNYSSVITNGKLRGYLDTESNLWDKTKTKVIGKIVDNDIQYIN